MSPGMIMRLFPASIDNRFRGLAIALWLFVPITLLKVALSLAHIFMADGGAQSRSMIPLDTYPEGAAQNIIGLMARLGLEQFLLATFMALALVRYRAMIPLMYLLVVVQFIVSRAVADMKPLAVAGTSGVGNFHLIVAMIAAVGLLLSLTGGRYREQG